VNFFWAALLVTLAGAVSAPVLAANETLGASVATSGAGFDSSAATNWNGTPGIYSPASIVSGLPLPDGTQWNLGTAYWSGTSNGDASQYLTIMLADLVTISSIDLQADNNDSYNVAYWNGAAWQSLTTFGGAGGWGLDTRPTFTLASTVTTDQFKIAAVGGDGWYAVGQFTANSAAAAVPEPETYTMLLAGLGLIGAMIRRRKV